MTNPVPPRTQQYKMISMDYGLVDLRPASSQLPYVWDEGQEQLAVLSAELRASVFPNGAQFFLSCGADYADIDIVLLEEEPPLVPGRVHLDVIIADVSEDMVLAELISGEGGPAFTPATPGVHTIRLEEISLRTDLPDDNDDEPAGTYLIQAWPVPVA